MEYLAYSNMVIANEGENIDIKYSLPKLQFTWKKQLKSAWLAYACISVLFAILAHAQATLAVYRGAGRYYVRTNGGCLHVRTGPSTSYPSVACYRNRSRLPRVIGSTNGFAQTDTNYYTSSHWIALSSRNDYSYGTNTDDYGYSNRIDSSSRYDYPDDTNTNYYGSRNRIDSSSRYDYPYNSNAGNSYNWDNNDSGILTRPDNYSTFNSGVRYPRLKLGSRGEAVRQVQSALGVRPTGYYDYATYNAVRNFQISNGLRADGVVGSQTARALGVYYS